MNIRDLNKLAMINNHSISMQNNIIIFMRDCENINLMNNFVFFIQFIVFKQNHHKFSFITHRDKEQLNVATMKFKNSPYV